MFANRGGAQGLGSMLRFGILNRVESGIKLTRKLEFFRMETVHFIAFFMHNTCNSRKLSP